MPHQTATLYITHLDDRVTEKMLKDIFSMISPVESVKLNVSDPRPFIYKFPRTLTNEKRWRGSALILS